MKEIKEHPWYIKDLPPYLSQSASDFHLSGNSKVDEEIVDRMYKV